MSVEGWRVFPTGPDRWPEPLRVVCREAFGRYALIQPFLAETANGEVLAGAAAIVNPRLPGLGQIGYFECIGDDREDDSAADPCRSRGFAAGVETLNAACAWLASRGLRSACGPMNGGAHRPHRLLVAGFGTGPFLLEPRNPPWYPGIWEAAGFAPAHRWASFELDAEECEALDERLAPVVRRALRRYEFVELDPKDSATLPRLHRLLDTAWRGHPGYASFDLEEFAETYAGLLALLGRDNLGVLADRETGEDAALGLAYPDVLAGEEGGRRLVLHTVAARPEDRDRGAPYLMLAEGLRVAREQGCERVMVALVTEDFRFFARTLAPSREYALYGKAL